MCAHRRRPTREQNRRTRHRQPIEAETKKPHQVPLAEEWLMKWQMLLQLRGVSWWEQLSHPKDPEGAYLHRHHILRSNLNATSTNLRLTRQRTHASLGMKTSMQKIILRGHTRKTIVKPPPSATTRHQSEPSHEHQQQDLTTFASQESRPPKNGQNDTEAEGE